MTRFRTGLWLLLTLCLAALPPASSAYGVAWADLSRGSRPALASSQRGGAPSADAEALMSAGEAAHDRGDFQAAVEAYRRAAALLRPQGAGTSLGSCLHNLARACRESGNYEAAEAAFLEAGQVFTAAGDLPAAARSRYALGLDVYWRIGRMEDAVRQYKAALRIWETVGDQVYAARALNNIGVVYFHWAEYEEALGYYNRSLSIRRRISDSAGVAVALNNIGQAYQKWGYPGKALNVYREAYDYARPLRGSNALAYTLYNIAAIHAERKEYGPALAYYRQAEREYRAADIPGGIIETFIGRAEIYEATGRTHVALRVLRKALEQARAGRQAVQEAKALQSLGHLHTRGGEHAEALRYFSESLSASRSLNDRGLVKDNYLLVSSSYEALGEHSESLRYYKLYAAAEDSIYGARSERLMREMEARFEAERRAEEVASLRRAGRQRQAAIVAISLSLGAVLLLALWLYRSNRQKKAANRLLAESNAQILRERDDQRALLQILGHDLANPLASVQGLLEIMLEDEETLPELGPAALQAARNGVGMINLVREMQLLERASLVLAPVELRSAVDHAAVVLQSRLREKNLALSIEVHPELMVWAEHRSLANSVLANLLTNAIKFSPDGSTIQVRAVPTEGNVCLSIRDHGIGMPASIRDRLFNGHPVSSRPGTNGEQGCGFGLPLVKRFVDRYGARIEATSSEADGAAARRGTEIRVTFRAAENAGHGTDRHSVTDNVLAHAR